MQLSAREYLSDSLIVRSLISAGSSTRLALNGSRRKTFLTATFVSTVESRYQITCTFFTTCAALRTEDRVIPSGPTGFYERSHF